MIGEEAMPLQRSRKRSTSGATPSGVARSRARGSTITQTMCLAKGGVAYVANRGNENNFGMRVNEVKIGGPGEEELLAEFFQCGEGDGTFDLAVRRRRRQPGPRLRLRRMEQHRSRCSTAAASSSAKWGTTGSGDGELLRPAGLGVREERQRHRCRQREQSPSGLQPARASSSAKCGKAGSGAGEFNQPWGITLDQGRQHLRRRLEESPHPEAVPSGQVHDDDRRIRGDPVPSEAFAVTYMGPFIAAASGTPGYPKPGLAQSSRPTSPWIADGDIYVADWGNHRVCVFDAEGSPIASLIGDAQVMSKWGQMSIDANPDMMKARRRVQEPRARISLLLPDRGRLRSGNRSRHRRRQPAEPAADLQEGSQLHRLPSEPVGIFAAGPAAVGPNALA